MDISESEHHWESLHAGESGAENDLDLSFYTVVDEHPEVTKLGKDGAGIPIEIPEELVVEEGRISPTAKHTTEDASLPGTLSIGPSFDTVTTVYEDVGFHGEVGRLELTKQRISFLPSRETAPPSPTKKHPHHSWRWKAIMKHQISPAKSGKIMMKLVAKGDDHKAVTFSFVNREELDKARKDVSERLRFAQAKETQTQNGNTPTKPRTVPVAVVSPDGTVEMEEPKLKDMEEPTESTALLAGSTARDIGRISEEPTEGTTKLGVILAGVVGFFLFVVLVWKLTMIIFSGASVEAASLAGGVQLDAERQNHQVTIMKYLRGNNPQHRS